MHAARDWCSANLRTERGITLPRSRDVDGAGPVSDLPEQDALILISHCLLELFFNI